MSNYARGNVVLVHFPYKEGGTTKLRPAVVIEGFPDESYICQITSKNRSDQFKGFWIEKDSSEGVLMGIKTDSFINVETTTTIKNIMIETVIGNCPFIDEIDDLI